MISFLIIMLFIVPAASTLSSYSALYPASDTLLLFPNPDFIRPWQYSDDTETYKDINLYEYINGAADLYLEYGFEKVVVKELVHGEESIIMEIYEMKNPRAAWGLFKNLKSPETKPVSDIKYGYSTPFSIVFTKNRYYIYLKSTVKSEECQQFMKKLAVSIAKKITFEQDNITDVFNCFPEKKRDADSYQIVFGPQAFNKILYLSSENILQLNHDMPALYVTYNLESGPFPVFLVSYPTETGADNAYAAFQKQFKAITSHTGLIKLAVDDTIFCVDKINTCLLLITAENCSDNAGTIIDQIKTSSCCDQSTRK